MVHEVISVNLTINFEFIEWFVGIEGESCFLCVKEGLVVGLEFVFRIALHRDERGALEHIKNTLVVKTERDTLVFTISQ